MVKRKALKRNVLGTKRKSLVKHIVTNSSFKVQTTIVKVHGISDVLPEVLPEQYLHSQCAVENSDTIDEFGNMLI